MRRPSLPVRTPPPRVIERLARLSFASSAAAADDDDDIPPPCIHRWRCVCVPCGLGKLLQLIVVVSRGAAVRWSGKIIFRGRGSPRIVPQANRRPLPDICRTCVRSCSCTYVYLMFCLYYPKVCETLQAAFSKLSCEYCSLCALIGDLLKCRTKQNVHLSPLSICR